MSSPAYWKLHRDQPGKPVEIGFKKGLIEVISEAPSIGSGRRYRVRCQCGKERVLLSAHIRRQRFTTHQACNAKTED